MSLPNYLAKIKSSGMYRFTFDKSQIPPQAAETMRLVVGYSEKGPFNNPVYIDNKQDFINLFGNINKRLEKKGVFFHRLALQALSAGPILALNLKPFKDVEDTAKVEVDGLNNETSDIKLTATCKEPTKIQLTWNDTSDKDGSVKYNIYIGDKKIHTTLENSNNIYEMSGLNANTQYNIKIVDTENNERFNTLSITTLEGETVNYVSFNPSDRDNNVIDLKSMSVRNLFDTNRFWKIDEDQLPSKIGSNANYINIAATETKEQSCSIFVRKCNSNDVKQYNVSVYDWYKSIDEEMPEYLEGHEDTMISDFFTEVYVFRGKFTDSIIQGALNNYFNAGTTTNADGTVKKDDKYGTLKTDYTNRFGENADALAALADDPNSNFIGLYRGCLLPYFKDQMGNFVSLDLTFNADKDIHKMIMKLDDSQIDSMMEITEVETENGKTTTYNLQWVATGWQAATGYESDLNDALVPTYIEGYTYTTLDKKSSAKNIQEESLNMLNDRGINEALTNHVDSEYHYIIDTFATLTNAPSSKSNISSIAKSKDNCLAIMNAPSMKELMSITDFNMKDFEAGKYKGSFSLPSEVNGASFCAYYTPLVFGEGVVKTIVPSAALVSNNFMEKWNSRQPYYIVAGPNYGVMDYEGMIGPDYNYSKSDLDVFEPMGINCMVYVPRKGTYINSNQTAKQTPVSALSKVHVRELVIFLQNEIENMMQNYQWELNTQTLRDTIKTKADTILEKIKNNGGVYDFLNVCDGTNNTPEVIDNEMVILDTAIEPARGAGKMVQRLTIHKTGGISALTK